MCEAQCLTPSETQTIPTGEASGRRPPGVHNSRWTKGTEEEMHGEDTRVTLDTSPELSHTLLAVHFQLIVKHCKDPWAAEASAVAAVPKPHNKARLLWDYLDASVAHWPENQTIVVARSAQAGLLQLGIILPRRKLRIHSTLSIWFFSHISTNVCERQTLYNLLWKHINTDPWWNIQHSDDVLRS